MNVLSRFTKASLTPLMTLALLGLALAPRPVSAALPPVGKAAPAFSAPSLATGKPVTLAALRAKGGVVLNFYQNSCGACRAEFPHLVSLAARAGKQGVQVIAIPLEADRTAAGKWRKEFKAGFPFLYDPNFTIARAYGVRATPTTIVIDKNGKVVQALEGTNARALDAAVKQISSARK